MAPKRATAPKPAKETETRPVDQRGKEWAAKGLTGNCAQRGGPHVLFCFVWLATLGMPVVAPGTAAGPFRRVAEAPFWVPSSPVVERGALSTEVPPHLKTR